VLVSVMTLPSVRRNSLILPLAKVLALAAQCGAVSVSQLIALPGQLQHQADTMLTIQAGA
jgi:hypothetical protein